MKREDLRRILTESRSLLGLWYDGPLSIQYCHPTLGSWFIECDPMYVGMDRVLFYGYRIDLGEFDRLFTSNEQTMKSGELQGPEAQKYNADAYQYFMKLSESVKYMNPDFTFMSDAYLAPESVVFAEG